MHPSDTSFYAGWGTLALVNAGLAQGKGRSGFLWFVGSLVLGPLATLLIVVLPATPQRA
ncbi:hypothetical protein [Lysobacter xanthus]